jgi:hypothetical protein
MKVTSPFSASSFLILVTVYALMDTITQTLNPSIQTNPLCIRMNHHLGPDGSVQAGHPF